MTSNYPDIKATEPMNPFRELRTGWEIDHKFSLKIK